MSKPIKFVNLNENQKVSINDNDAVVLRDSNMFYQVNWSVFQQVMVGDIQTRLNNIETSITLGSGPSLWPRQQPLNVTGAVTGSVSFDGSGEINLQTTLNPELRFELGQINGLEERLTQLQESIGDSAETPESHQFQTPSALATNNTYSAIPKDVTISHDVTDSQINGWSNSGLLTLNHKNDKVSQVVFNEGRLGYRDYGATGWNPVKEVLFKQDANLDQYVKRGDGQFDGGVQAQSFSLKRVPDSGPAQEQTVITWYTHSDGRYGLSYGSMGPEFGEHRFGVDDGVFVIGKTDVTFKGKSLLTNINFDPNTKLDATAVAEAAKKWETPVNFSVTGAVEGSTTFDGSSGINLVLNFRDQGIPKSKVQGLNTDLESFAPKNGVGAEGEWGIDVTGNAATATKLKDPVTVTLSGAIAGTVEWDGGNLNITTTAGEGLEVGAEVTSKISDLETLTQNHTNRIGGLEQYKDSATTAAGQLSNKVDTLETTIDQHTAKLAELEGNIPDTSELTSEINSLKQTTQTHTTQIQTASSDASAAKSKAEQNETAIQGIQTNLNSSDYVKVANSKITLSHPVESTSTIKLTGNASLIGVGYLSGTANGISCSGGFSTNGEAGWSNTSYVVGVKPHSYSGVGSLNDKPFYASNFITTSDARVKRDIRDFELRDSLHPVQYERIDTGETELGFIAQEVNMTYPEAVRYDVDEDRWRLVPTAILAILAKEINDLRKEVRDLKAKVQSQSVK